MDGQTDNLSEREKTESIIELFTSCGEYCCRRGFQLVDCVIISLVESQQIIVKLR